MSKVSASESTERVVTGREELVARKESVQARKVQLRREVEREQSRANPRESHIRNLERELDVLMAEEQRLRHLIDRTP